MPTSLYYNMRDNIYILIYQNNFRKINDKVGKKLCDAFHPLELSLTKVIFLHIFYISVWRGDVEILYYNIIIILSATLTLIIDYQPISFFLIFNVLLRRIHLQNIYVN